MNANARHLVPITEGEGDGLDSFRRQRTALVAEIAALNQEFFELMGRQQSERSELDKGAAALREEIKTLALDRDRLMRDLSDERANLEEVRARRVATDGALQSQRMELEKVSHEALLCQSQLSDIEVQTLEAQELWNKVIRRVEKETQKLDALKAEVSATETVRKEAELLDVRLKELERASAAQRNKLDELSRAEADYRTRAVTAESELGVVLRQVKQAESERSNAEERMQELARHLSQRHEQLAQADTELKRRQDALQSFMDQHRKAIEDAAAAERVRNDAVNDTKRLEHEIRQLREERTHVQMQVGQEKDALNALGEQVAAKRREAEALDARVGGNEERIRFQQEHMVELQRQQAAVVAKSGEIESERAALHAKVVELESQIGAQQRNIQLIAEQHAQELAQLDRTKKAGMEMSRMLDAQRRQKEELEARCQGLVTEGQRTKEQNAVFVEEERGLREKLAPLRQELAELDAKLKSGERELAQNEKVLADKKAQIRAADADFKELETQHARLRVEFAEASEKLAASRRAEGEAVGRMEEAEAQVNRLQAQRAAAAELLAREQRALIEADSRKDEALARMVEIERAAGDAEARLASLRDAENRFVESIKTSKENLAQLQHARIESERNLAQTDAEAAHLRDSLATLKRELAEAEHDCEMHRSLMRGIQSEFEALETIRRDKLSDIEGLREKLREAQVEVAATKQQQLGIRALEHVGEAERALDRLRRRLDL